MRLTLRTMLAFMDDILEPDDAREIGKKIEESEFATNLLHRTRDVMRRLRLAAPSVTDRGPGLDPNTVAEYLDNTLPGDRVPDFEKICLESDVHLAEVASCHQVLAAVLGEPAEVDVASRQRMYQLPDLVAVQVEGAKQPPAAEPEPSGRGPSEEEEQAKRPRPRPIVPEYLREPPRKRRTLVSAVTATLLALLFVLVVLAALGQFERGSFLATHLGIAGPQRQLSERPDAGGPLPKRPAIDSGAPREAGQAQAGSQAAKPAPAEVSAPPTAPPAAPQPEPTKPQQPADSASPPGVAAAPPGPAGKADAGASGTSADKSGPAVLEPAATPGVKPAEAAPPPPAATPPTSPPAAEGPRAVTAPPPSEPVGRFISDKQVLLQYDSASAAWQRAPAQAVLNSSTPLLALPAYQPMIALPLGTTLHLMGGTEIELLPIDAQGTPGLRVSYGRLVIRAVGETKTRLRLQIAERSGVIGFKGAGADLAIAVFRVRTPGTNPETEPGILTADLSALSGEFLWEEGADRPAVPVPAPGRLTLSGQLQPVPAVAQELPKWATTDETSLLDRQAAVTLEQSLQLDRPIVLALQELVDHRRREVGWLAIRCLGCVGQLEPMVAVLNSPEQKTVWETFINHLQSTVARSPEAAAEVRQALERHYGQDAAAVYRMLWGYTEKDLQGGQVATLIECLDHEVLALRVLSFHNLEAITKLRFAYRPEDTASNRLKSIARWRERLQAGLLGNKAPDEREKKTSPDSAILP